MPEHPMVTTWKGKPVDELTREELIEAINYCGEEMERLRRENMRLAKAMDLIKYLLQS